MPDPIPPRWGRRLADRPFRVLAEWIEFAHSEDAVRGRPQAARLIAAPSDGTGAVFITDRALVAEVVAVAERFAVPGSAAYEDPRLWFRLYPASIVKRGAAWLRAVEVVGQG